MKKIRYGTFETNSSSTHAIVIPKKIINEEYSSYDSLEHNYSFDREECRLCDNWDEKLAYAYMLLLENYKWSHSENTWRPKNVTTKKEICDFKEKILLIWKELFKNEDIHPTPKDLFKYIDRDGKDGNLIEDDIYLTLEERENYIDHVNELDDTDFLIRLKTDDEFVKRFIFNRESYITICGDEYRGYNIKTIGFEHDYDCKEHNVNENWEEPPANWFDKKGCVKDGYWDRYLKEYPYDNSDFWKKLIEYKKDNDVYLKGN